MLNAAEKDRKYFIITGGQMENKGAQAMTFICVNEIQRRFPNVVPVIFSNIDYGKEYLKKYTFMVKPYPSYKRVFADIFSRSILKIENIHREIFMNAVAMLDVSGYKFGSNWGNSKAIEYLKMIALAKNYSVPVYIMPQSFGPLDFVGVKGKIIDILARHYLKYPRIIMARENEGKKYLENKYSLKNVIKTSDLVLVTAYIDTSAIYSKEFIDSRNFFHSYDIEPGGVAIIPNSKNDIYGESNNILEIYRAMIDKLLSVERSVYLLFHSRDDVAICHRIKDLYKDEDRVHLIEEELSCIEYEKVIVFFDFVIASRYHSIVHSYKAGTPAIIIGWATKYYELAQEMHQEKYHIDVRKELRVEKILNLVEIMHLNYQNESEIIRKEVSELQRHNLFDVLMA